LNTLLTPSHSLHTPYTFPFFLLLIYIFRMKMDFDSFCWPAKIYLVILIVSLLFGLYQNFSVTVLLLKTIFGLLWLLLLHYLCTLGYQTIAWVLLLLPYVFIILVIATTVEVLNVLSVSKNGV